MSEEPRKVVLKDALETGLDKDGLPWARQAVYTLALWPDGSVTWEHTE